MTERTVKCPQCGQMVQVPVTGEKVRCPGCGQKFRFDLPPLPPMGVSAPPPPLPPAEPPPLPETKVSGPLPETKISGPPPEAKAPEPPPLQPLPTPAAPPLPAPPPANEVRCPRCGSMVQVPLTGEKVRCPGCGQKFRFEVPAGSAAGALPALASDDEPTSDLPPPMPGPAPATGPITDIAPAPALTPLASAEELNFLWPSLCQFIARRYEEGRADDDDRLRFRTQADRAAALTRAFLPSEGSAAYEFLTAVLPQTTLDEILRLNLEDFRHLQESLDEAQMLLALRLRPAAPAPALPQIAVRPPVAERPAAAERPAPARKSSLAAWVGVGAMVAAAIAVVLAWPSLQPLLGQKVESPRPLTSGPVVLYQPPTATPTPERPKIKAPEPKPASKTSAIELPKFEKPQTSTPAPPTPPRPELKETPPVQPDAVKRILSPWKVTPESWIDLFNGRDLEGLTGDPETWSVKDGVLIGNSPNFVSPLGVQQANWTDYTLTLDLRLGSKGTLAIGHGPLAAFFADAKARLGYPGEGARVLDETSKGLARNQWHQVEFEVKGPRAEVRVNGKQVLTTAGHTPQAGAPSVEIHNGAVALRSFRLRMHESDPDYRAVVGGEGYIVKEEAPAVPDKEKPPVGVAAKAGWTQIGAWNLNGDTFVGSAMKGDRALLVAGDAGWQDYTFRARAHFTRVGRSTREGEYILFIVRYQNPNSFYCIRFAIEGVFEVGYYRNGQFHDVEHARAGLNNWFDREHSHDIRIQMRGDQLTLTLDKNTYPPYTLKGLDRGGVALGVTGGEAAFRDPEIHALR